MNLGSIMTRRVVAVEMDDSLRVINGIFTHAKFHHLLVLENKKLMGVISDRDVLKAMSPFLDTLAERPRDAATLERRAHQIMTRELVTGTSEMDIAEAVQLMLQERVSCLPVLSENGQVEGVVTWKDLLTAFVDTAEVLCPVCRLRVDVRQRYGKA
jgi:acetoin utilization protein AcuB